MTTTIGTLLRKRALLDRDTLAVVTPSERLTFGEIDRRTERLAAAFAKAGIGKGDRIATLLRNSAETIEIYYAAAKRGAILCNLNLRLSPPELAYILEDSEPKLLIAGDDFLGLMDEIAAETALPEVWQAPDGTRDHLPRLDERRDAATVDRAGPDERDGDPQPDDPLLLVYTSGTTGRPKGAVLTHSGMFWTSATVAFSLDYRYRDMSLIPVPMFHVGGMSFVTCFVHTGATAVVPPMWEPGAILETIERERVNHFFAVAAMLRSLLDHPEFEKADLSSIRWIMAGGAPVPPALIERFDTLGIPVQQTYGSTETAGPATFVDLAHVVAKAGSAGLPFFHTEVRIADGDGGRAAPDAVGEIEIRAPHLISGYWRNEAATEEAFRDGWLQTGDLGFMDAEGYLFIVDRKKDVIISGGENIYPSEVEAVLEKHPGVAEVAVVALPDERWGEVPCAVVAPADAGAPPSLDDLLDFSAGQLARYKLPKRLVVTPEPLPRNATGKLLKHVIRDRVRDA